MTQKGRLADSVAEIEKIAEAILLETVPRPKPLAAAILRRRPKWRLRFLSEDEPRKTRRTRRPRAID